MDDIWRGGEVLYMLEIMLPSYHSHSYPIHQGGSPDSQLSMRAGNTLILFVHDVHRTKADTKLPINIKFADPLTRTYW